MSAEVWAKYLDPESTGSAGTAFAQLIEDLSNNASSVVIDAISPGSEAMPSFIGILGGNGEQNSGAPRAYLNLMVFDLNFQQVGNTLFKQISTAAQEDGSDISHEYISINPVTITEPGYVYIYLSNENVTPVEVFFDDFKVTHTPTDIVQKDDYYPFGLTFNSLLRENSLGNKYLFNGKERQELTGWDDYGARMYMADIGRWGVVDPLAEQFPSWSPYSFSFNNPLRFIDPDGRAPWDVIIKGAESQAAFNELQASVQGQLNLSMDANGKVTYTQVGEGKLSNDAQQLTNAIDNSSIVVNVNAENTTTTSSGDLYIGGAFAGNTVTKGADGNTVVAEQEVNPGVLGKMSTAHGKPGADMLHEVTEAYQGGLISQKQGTSSPASNKAGSVYPRAHGRATKQSGSIFERIYDASGKEMKMAPSGGYPVGAKSADWYVKDKKGNKVVIQELK
ncbi:RHS repeat-associated core domain-containing protein [Algoriphagus persicinus]|uniref:RHS repeat-associated core domain-containing protein n=1 Tax=Algoriphagus persicinus TaxID=3108754 RepID=UPI002B41457E|nr:RHS repeat-associated core domain-containing protein [Algoriphagus sp. E1-3-M2]